ncbi:MAG: hypothetical protein O2819_01185 [Planctomycetota bacterium]|nr:hypothetical protein [Planctomycetota bacterium]MDA1105604.1 hypothetical protein [Planctomycetota bacterium]
MTTQLPEPREVRETSPSVSTSAALRKRWDTLSPAGRAGVWAVGVLAVYFGLEDTAWRWAAEWRTEGDRIEQLMRRDQTQVAEGNAARNLILIHGDLRPPRDAASGSQELAEAITQAMERQHISGFSFEARGASKLPAGSFANAVPAGQRVDRASVEVSFESQVEEAIKVIAELESEPALDAIHSLAMDWDETRRKVTVRLVLDAWVLSTGRAARRTP